MRKEGKHGNRKKNGREVRVKSEKRLQGRKVGGKDGKGVKGWKDTWW